MTHRPKTAALLAYAEELLSPTGRARLERHLTGCPTCRDELAAILLYERVAEEARAEPAPAVDFGRMERVLAEEAGRISQAIARTRRRRPAAWAFGAVALAAAALLALVLGWPGEAPPTTTERVAPAPAPEWPTPEPVVEAPESPALRPVVTLAAGGTERFDEDRPASVRVGEALSEGSRVRTGPDGEVHARLSEGTGFVVPADSEVRLARAREAEIVLEVVSGRVDSAVAHLGAGARYVVLAGGHSVEVRGTQFAVAWRDGAAEVELAEGAVEVTTPSGERISLRAPTRWTSAGPVSGDPQVTVARAHRGADRPWTLVTLAHPDLVRWEVDGTAIGAGSAQLLMRPGEHEVQGWDARGRPYAGRLMVGMEPVAVEPSVLTAQAPRARPGHLAPAEITAVLNRGRRQLARCYERSLRVRPEVRGRVRLRITVGASGDVQRVRVVGADPTANTALQECVATHAQRWTFPPPGGPVTFEVPFAFSARTP